MAWRILNDVVPYEFRRSLRAHLRRGKFWQIASRDGTLAGAYFAGFENALKTLHTQINDSAVSAIPGESVYTLAYWERLCGYSLIGTGLTNAERIAFLRWWLFGKKYPLRETVDSLATALGITVTWGDRVIGTDQSLGVFMACGDIRSPALLPFSDFGTPNVTEWRGSAGHESPFVMRVSVTPGTSASKYWLFADFVSRVTPAHIWLEVS